MNEEMFAGHYLKRLRHFPKDKTINERYPNMSASDVTTIKMEDIPVDDIDFSDLEKEYSIDDEFSFDQYVVVSGAPVIPESKVPVLQKALTGLFSKAGKVVNMDFPIDEASFW